ncbi:MAG: ThuA domain-containing protein [Zavarzinella sp.]
MLPTTIRIAVILLFTMPLAAQVTPPKQAEQQMVLPKGFAAKCVAHEPLVRQPLSMSFDHRGRLWVLQYLQYPNPAGLKAVSQDRYLRTVWDRVPEPPPVGPKGVDRITILSEPNAEGVFTKSHDFLDNLNLATGFALAPDGVYVLQSPYLLFYPDKNRDDIPDGDPEVLVKGFGMEDTHSYANSLQFGPDGWLYGAHGSTVTAKIKNPARPDDPIIEFQQGIWRYHPKTKQFELFSEGGGNTYGLDFDATGQVIAGTNYGGKAMLHQVQGGYYVKGFSKHGPLHNPHTYGYFDHVPYRNFKGGHVTCGGVIYQADLYPKEYHNQYIAGNLLSNAIYWHKMERDGSTFQAEHGGDLMTTTDIWFRPVDCFQGPDGCVYVADWYDKRAAHLDPLDTWHKTSGRIYRIEYGKYQPPPKFDFSKLNVDQLIDYLKHPNKWYRNEARLWLTKIGTPKDHDNMLEMCLQQRGTFALELLWAAHGIAPCSGDALLKVLQHPDEAMREWAVRLMKDYSVPAPVRRPGEMRRDYSTHPLYGNTVNITPDKYAEKLVDFAKTEQSVRVCSQLACTAKKYSMVYNLAISRELAQRPELQKDPHLPLMIWWSIEEAFSKYNLQENPNNNSLDYSYLIPIIQNPFFAERFSQRFMAKEHGFRALLFMLSSFPKDAYPGILKGMAISHQGKKAQLAEHWLEHWLNDKSEDFANNRDFQQILLRYSDPTATKRILTEVGDAKVPPAKRIESIKLLGELQSPGTVEVLTKILKGNEPDVLRLAALTSLSRFYRQGEIADYLLAQWQQFSRNMQIEALRVLFQRPATANQLFAQIDQTPVLAQKVPKELLLPLLESDDATTKAKILKHWGQIAPATPGEKQARITWLSVSIPRLGKADLDSGAKLFQTHCASCHQFQGKGEKIGPDLTTADRKNRNYMLSQMVDPSGYIRPEFVSNQIHLLDGRKLTGIAKEDGEGRISISQYIDNKVQQLTVAKSEIEEMYPSRVSLMPEKILDQLSEEQIRDLLAYLASDPPPVKPAPQPEPPCGEQPEKTEKKLKVLLISGSLEYESDKSLAILQAHLEKNYPVECLRAFRKTDTDLPGLEQLEQCDVAVFFTRRLKIDGKQLEMVKKYVQSGKPVVGIRTASHGFQNWLEMDKEIFGGNYKNHYSNKEKCTIAHTKVGEQHLTLEGVKPYVSNGSLYKNPDLPKDVTVLMTGTITGHTEPITWVREHKGARIFYTSLGHQDDFKEASFLHLLTNAIFWTANQPVPKQ